MKLLSRGRRRLVYSYDNKILKINKHNYLPDFNLQEWQNWLKVKGTEFEKYFCPCIEYRDDTVLLMEKGEKINWKDEKYYNVLVSAIFTDRKPKNFCLYKNRIVGVDYHRINSLQHKLITINKR
jgi:hypothetical protein